MKMPRRKPRNVFASIAHRANRLLPSVNFMLDLAAITNRLAFENAANAGLDVWGVNPFLHKNIRPTDRVLEIGCNTGRVLSQVKAAERVGVDTDAGAIKRGQRAHSELTLLCADARDYPGDFDVVILSHVLEHLDEPGDLLRTLKGRIYVEVPDFDANTLNAIRAQRGLIAYADIDHVNEFSRDELEDLFNSCGLQIIDSEYRWGFLRYWLTKSQ